MGDSVRQKIIKKWTEEELILIKSIYNGSQSSLKILSEQLNRNIEAIRVKLQRIGVYVYTCKIKPWINEEIQKLKKLYLTHSTKELCNIFDRKTRTIEAAITKHIDVKIANSKRILKKIMDGEQQCSSCGKTKLLSEFQDLRRKQCSNCRIKAAQIRLKQKIANMSKEELEKYKAHNNELARKNHKLHPERKKIQELKRREREKNYQTTLTKEDIVRIITKFNNMCFKCKSDQHLSLDHHYALSKGFGLCEHTAVVLCKCCNSSKNNKEPEEFYSQEELLTLYNEYKILKKEEVKHIQFPSTPKKRSPPPILRGTNNNKCKLNENKVLEIRELHKNGERIKDLAIKFTVTNTTICDIVKRKSWKWLSENIIKNQ